MCSKRILLLTILLFGCTPYRTIVSPELSVKVVDENGTSIPGAIVNMAIIDRGFVSTQSESIRQFTDERGVATIPNNAEWGIVFWVPDAGPRNIAWSFCVEKEGFKPSILIRLDKGSINEHLVIELPYSQDNKRCEWRKHDNWNHEYEVVSPNQSRNSDA